MPILLLQYIKDEDVMTSIDFSVVTMAATAVNNVVQPPRKKVKLSQVPILQNISTPAEAVSITIHRIGMEVGRW